jgi:ABC-type sugar transport system permease subunit/ABC-type glycerol-3-phosphate transport system substrate-binding protein
MLGLCAGSALASSGTVTLYYWGNEQDTLAPDLIADFETLHSGQDGKPAIRVISAQSASVNKTNDPQRLLCGIAGGDPPDVVWFDRFAVGEWASRDAFLPLQEFLERDLRERPDDPFTLRPELFYEPTWQECIYNETMYAIPETVDNRALFYNQDLFDKHAVRLIAAGCVDPDDPAQPGPPRTWEQLRAAAEILTERRPDGSLERVGFIPNYGNSWLYLYGWLNGGTFLSEDGQTCTLNEPAIVEALTYVTELYDLMGGAKKVNAFQISQEGGDLDPLIAGRIAMRIDYDGVMGNIANARPDMRFGVALPPAPEGMPRFGWCGGWCFVIPRGSEYPEEAWTFIKYMVSRRAVEIKANASQQAARAAGGRFIPVMHSRRDITEWLMETYVFNNPELHERYKKGVKVIMDNLPVAKFRPVSPAGQVLWNAQVVALDQAIYKEFDATDTRRNAQMSLDRHAARVQVELDRIFTPDTRPVLRFGPIVAVYALLVLLGIGGALGFAMMRTQSRGYHRHEMYAGFAFAAPWFLGFLIFGGGPLLFSLFMSFCEYDVFNPPRWNGLGNYTEMLSSSWNDEFYLSLWNTVYMALGIPLGLGLSLAIAMLLNFEIKGMAVYRTFFYLPAIMPAVAASILWRWIFNPDQGVLNAFIGLFGLSGPLWLQDQHWAKPALILMGLWGAGGGMIVWLAGLKGIPTHLYEAAELDGAGPFRRFTAVTLPMISPYILFNCIMGLIGTFQIFTQAYIMTQGGPVNSTLFYAYLLFNNAFRYMRMGYASAMAWILFAIVLALTVVQLRLSKKWVYYESEK